jgi:hypothetical protein
MSGHFAGKTITLKIKAVNTTRIRRGDVGVIKQEVPGPF